MEMDALFSPPLPRVSQIRQRRRWVLGENLYFFFRCLPPPQDTVRIARPSSSLPSSAEWL